MLKLKLINIILIIIGLIITIVCSIGIVIASKFQNKQRKKYNDCLNLIKEKENMAFQVKYGLSKEEINSIDESIDVDKLMSDLYETYLEFENKLKILDNNLDNILTGYIKEFYINKIENYKLNGYRDIIDSIYLINYSITEFSKEKLKFRVTINCFDYRQINNEVIIGSNIEKVEEVLILTYEYIDDKWLISNYEKVYQKKLND